MKYTNYYAYYENLTYLHSGQILSFNSHTYATCKKKNLEELLNSYSTFYPLSESGIHFLNLKNSCLSFNFQ